MRPRLWRCCLRVLIVIACATGNVYAKEGIDSPSPITAGQSMSLVLPDLKHVKMIGVKLSGIDEFWNKWHLVTTRFRKDNGEQRFIFANDIAYRAMKNGTKVYPDGAMFGKVAFLAYPDAAFPNSYEPEHFTRIQLMRKNAAEYSATNGWGYAYYFWGEKSAGVANKDIGAVCHACHAIVKDRDYVFSRPSFLLVGDNPQRGNVLHEQKHMLSDMFIKRNVSDLSANAKNAVKSIGVTSATIQYLEMPLFVGSVSESIAPLAQYAIDKSATYLLIDEKSGAYLIAAPLPENSQCKKHAKLVARMIPDPSFKIITSNNPAEHITDTNSKRMIFIESEFCDGVNGKIKVTR